MLKKSIAALAASMALAAPANATTYTVEPDDGDGGMWTMSLTQLEFGGSQCPCEKVQYTADGMPWHNQQGADEIWKLVQQGTIKSGDEIMGFSLGVQVIALYMSQHPLPPGVKLLLAGDTFWRNQQELNLGQGIPWNTPTQVTMVANQYDGWSDYPDKTTAPGYRQAVVNAEIGAQEVHNYIHAQLNNPANVVETRGNITAILIPNQKLPIGNESLRAGIDGAYSRPSPTQEQLAAAGPEQVQGPIPPQPAEAVAK
jgi:PE-PPE domain